MSSDYYNERLARAPEHHASAIRTLAQIRKMGPAVQINTLGQENPCARVHPTALKQVKS